MRQDGSSESWNLSDGARQLHCEPYHHWKVKDLLSRTRHLRFPWWEGSHFSLSSRFIAHRSNPTGVITMIQFQVEGMSCNHCVGSITRAVQAVDPAARVSADVPTQSVKVESAADRQALQQAIEGAGYPVKSAS
ncbi:copper chaperone, heavy metal ion binding (modular protein) [Cupriavidus metallidurans CH34]|uniref:Copper chaperone, heavy metal ion binding (Modular protein) n=2 Tax=Cupriavidus metallidurans TaxID=119219 RepID=Q1LHH9_CUPMC|nr:copper chaperone, heavy metal ion binding (modular protein) [Cupriavidus metallidurans CH34]